MCFFWIFRNFHLHPAQRLPPPLALLPNVATDGNARPVSPEARAPLAEEEDFTLDDEDIFEGNPEMNAHVHQAEAVQVLLPAPQLVNGDSRPRAPIAAHEDYDVGTDEEYQIISMTTIEEENSDDLCSEFSGNECLKGAEEVNDEVNEEFNEEFDDDVICPPPTPVEMDGEDQIPVQLPLQQQLQARYHGLVFDDDEIYESVGHLYQEPEPFDFGLLPPNIKSCVVEKMEFQDYMNLERTSKVGMAASRSGTYSLPFQMHQIMIKEEGVFVAPSYDISEFLVLLLDSPVRPTAKQLTISGHVTSNSMRKAALVLGAKRVSVEGIMVVKSVNFEAKDLDEIIQITGATSLSCKPFLKTDFFDSPFIQKMKILNLKSTGCTGDQLMKIEADEIEMIGNFLTKEDVERYQEMRAGTATMNIAY